MKLIVLMQVIILRNEDMFIGKNRCEMSKRTTKNDLFTDLYGTYRQIIVYKSSEG